MPTTRLRSTGSGVRTRFGSSATSTRGHWSQRSTRPTAICFDRARVWDVWWRHRPTELRRHRAWTGAFLETREQRDQWTSLGRDLRDSVLVPAAMDSHGVFGEKGRALLRRIAGIVFQALSGSDYRSRRGATPGQIARDMCGKISMHVQRSIVRAQIARTPRLYFRSDPDREDGGSVAAA